MDIRRTAAVWAAWFLMPCLWQAHAAERIPDLGPSRVATSERQLDLRSEVIREGEAPPRILRVAVINAAGQRRCLPRQTTTGALVGLEPVIVGSFGAVDAVPGLAARAEDLSLVLLLPGERKTVELDLSRRFDRLPDDTYSVFARYALPPGVGALLAQPAAERRCTLPGMVESSNHVKVRVRGVPGSLTAREFAGMWRSGKSPDERWRALRWLAHNALSAGMLRTEILATLGEPSEARDPTRWAYSVGHVGIVVRFSGDTMADLTFFET